MIQLLLHLLGDYFLQNDWMALNKSKYNLLGWYTCLLHCWLYAFPFGMYYQSWSIFTLVFATHFLIDKFGLAVYVTRLMNWNWDGYLGFDEDRPKFITVWIHIIRDNSMHIACNYFIIKYFL